MKGAKMGDRGVGAVSKFVTCGEPETDKTGRFLILCHHAAGVST